MLTYIFSQNDEICGEKYTKIFGYIHNNSYICRIININMTLQEIYSTLGGNYNDAKQRLMNDKLISKFLLRFIDDPTMSQLLDAVKIGDRKASFSAAHTLKGVAGNLGLTALVKSASALTEQLRSLEQDADPSLVKDVKEQYDCTISTIKTLV